MALPPLYKYLDVRGAKLTLGNGTFRHAKPSDFNDTEELTVQSLFPEETEAALKKLSDGFIDVLLRHLDDPPTCNSPQREKIALIQHAFRTNPKAAEIVKVEMSKDDGEPIYDVEHMRERSKAFIDEINELMQRYRIFCVSTHRDSEEMWLNYAENHKGIMLRVESNVAKDSKFQLFRPVEYREKRPPFFDDVLDFAADGIFGDHQALLRASVDKIIYSKTLRWEHEAEYRLAIALRRGEPPWDMEPYHPEEITELYLGLGMTNDDMQDIVSKARARNPAISIFRMHRDQGEKLTFNRT
jgi:hypothetical protein